MSDVHLSWSVFCLIFGACFQCTKSQTFSSLGTCDFNCIESRGLFTSNIVPSAGLPWSFNWVWDPDGRNTIIASVTVLTGNAPMVITPTGLFPYAYNISNVPDSGVVSPQSFVSSLSVNINGSDSIVLGIPGSASNPCNFVDACGVMFGLSLISLIGIGVGLVVFIALIIGSIVFIKKHKNPAKSSSNPAKAPAQAETPL